MKPYDEKSLDKPKQMEIFEDREWLAEKQKEMKSERDGSAQWMKNRGSWKGQAS